MNQVFDINGCISFTLKWLQNSDNEIQAINQAQVSGLLKNDLTDLWSADTKMSELLLQDALNRDSLLPDNSFLAQIFIGLGEMSAHSHADLITPMEQKLLNSQYKALLSETINTVIERYTLFGKPYSDEELAMSKAIAEAPFSWQTLLTTQHICSRLGFSSRYGISYSAKLFLRVDAEGFAKWFSDSTNEAIYSITETIAEELVFKKDKKLISILINTGGNALKSLCASALMTPFERDIELDYKKVAAQLIKSGISSGDTLWITGYLLKEAIHSRYRLKSRVSDNKAQLTHLKSICAEQSDQNTKQEKEFIEASHENIISSLDNAEKEIDRILIEMATIWPAKGMTPLQFEQLKHCFVDTQEIKYKLAIQLGQEQDKEKLLKDNINAFKKYVGITSKSEVTKDFLSFHDHDGELLLWTAYSFIELNKGDSKPLSRILGNLVKSHTDNLNQFIEQPYIVQRQSEKWISATSRLAVLHYFVLTVYEVSDEEKKKEIEEILPFAVEHVLLLFRQVKGRWQDLVNDLPDKLIIETAFLIRSINSIESYQNMVIYDKKLPDYLRALVIWGNPQLTQENTVLAKHLFVSIGTLPSAHSQVNRCLIQILNVLDIAIANSKEAEQEDELIKLWEEIYQDWQGVLANSKWARTAEWLISAINGDELSQKEVIESSTWRDSNCCLKLSK